MENVKDYSIKNDIIFKHVFSNKDILKDFLEAILNKKINTIEIDKLYNLQKINFSHKELYLDIKATINNEEIVVLEMQKSKDPDFINRLVLYISAINREQVETAEECDKLKKVYSLAILNYIMRENIEKYHTIWSRAEESNLKYKLEETPSIHMMELT
ncbi:MAG: Rpn family recombination-promoting nuclease/putative transposase [Clostridia bacterium]|nr:Rpn family recombination-promoting nuclease/putative transposase [Clostridia bacterium]